MMSLLISSLQWLYLLIISAMTIQAIFNIRLRLFLWEEPENAWSNHAPTVYREPRISFTILCRPAMKRMSIAKRFRRSITSIIRED